MEQLILEASFYDSLTEVIKPLLRLASCHIIGIHAPNELNDPSMMENFCISLLDAGAVSVNFRVIPEDTSVSLHILKGFLGQFPRTRIGVYLDKPILSVNEINFITEELVDAVSYFFVSTEISDKAITIFDKAKTIVSSNIEVHIIFKSIVSFTPSTEDIIKFTTIHENIHTSIVANVTSADGTTDMSNPMTPTRLQDNTTIATAAADSIDLLGCFIGCLKTDRLDGLYTTVVCDESNVCLGLVYSNEQSIRAAICEGKGIYWSRSRGGLWRKGDTSGMFQELLSVKYDCDRDALRFSVIQHGVPKAFCHLLTRTCWGHETGLQKLESTLKERKQSAPEGSYTKKLFDNPDSLNQYQQTSLYEPKELYVDNRADIFFQSDLTLYAKDVYVTLSFYNS